MAKINTNKQSYIVGWVGLKLADDYFITYNLYESKQTAGYSNVCCCQVCQHQSPGLISCYVNATVILNSILSYLVMFFTMYQELALILK